MTHIDSHKPYPNDHIHAKMPWNTPGLNYTCVFHIYQVTNGLGHLFLFVQLGVGFSAPDKPEGYVSSVFTVLVSPTDSFSVEDMQVNKTLV
jgi:hypothetical protein